jgi:hypothetical protein
VQGDARRPEQNRLVFVIAQHNNKNIMVAVLERPMSNATISIEIDEDTARAFAKASGEQQRKLQLLLSLRLRELTLNPSRTLEIIMDQMGHEAETRGLTPEILESLLRGE